MQPLENCQDGGGKGKRKDVCYLELARIVQQAASMSNSFTRCPRPKAACSGNLHTFQRSEYLTLAPCVRAAPPVRDANCDGLK
jgi:hypothetical protein